MVEYKKLDRWADKLLDTGKRNNLINFKDTKSSSAEILYPNCESIFSKCHVGQSFEVFDPMVPDSYSDAEETTSLDKTTKTSKDDFKNSYSSRLKNDRFILVYAQTPNPITAVKNIAKKAQGIQDETGINVAYLAFGFIKWNEKEDSNVYYRAPLLLVHVNIITGSIIDPIKIEISDDDVVVNPTFSYLLQAEYQLSLPDYADDEPLESYYEKVSNIVRRKGWTIIDECKLGIFSFLKINMYEDLKQNAGLIIENTNVKALLGGTSFTDTVGFSDVPHIVNNPLIELHTVVAADSSQIEAIEMAKSGKSFVLQGPPGTGKSQTITNIIAECLHDGKKILFVSEKQAALNVVFDKLKKAGLADFCLELHSHKANKKAVIDELNRTLEIPKSIVSSSTQEEICQKEEAQTRLDQYASALHQKRETINRSLYQLFEAHSKERQYPELSINIKAIQNKGSDYFLRAVKLLEQYTEYIPYVGENYRQNVWYGFKASQINFDEHNQLKSDLALVLNGFSNLQETTIQIRERYELPKLNYSDTLRWQSFLSFLAGSDVITPALLYKNIYDYALPYLVYLQSLSKTIIPTRNALLEELRPEALHELNGQELYTDLTERFSGFFSRVFSSDYKKLITSIQSFMISNEKLKYPKAVAFAQQLIQYQSLEKTYTEYESLIKNYLGPSYIGPDTEWEHVISSLQALQKFFNQETPQFGSLPQMRTDEFLKQQTLFQSDADRLSNELESIASAKNHISQLFAPEILDLENNDFDYCIKKLNGCFTEFDKLVNWIGFLELLEQLKEADLLSIVDYVINNQVKTTDIVGSYRRTFYKQWIEYIIFSVPELASFSRVKQDQAVQNFKSKDELQYEISKVQIKSELSQKRPTLDLISGGSSVSILRRESMKKRKQMPIRKLLSETGNLVQILKPCFLMSPLSVSTFLEPGKITFDTVVFDEASQIFPQDAIGAIYRGTQLIVVGDSKQMPPSNFFNSATDIEEEDDEIGDITDFESILDICSTVFSTERLTWHYRSHYEQLIAFSNANFYRNNLITFPSNATDKKWIGVDYYYAGGIFDRKSKTNKGEAEFIVDLIYQNIDRYPTRSLGVVAFSVAQQTLIDRLLSKRRESDPSYEWFFKSDNEEPFFIKNLETVQGDERDTIIFSVAYAKDTQGRFINNFGPLNREGGERRLNVAVTRAKDNVQLVASIHYTDIDLSNSGSEGVRLLRAYLDYAQNGEEALGRELSVQGEDHFDSYFEQEVCDYLRDHGFTVDTQVGCSGYKIDLGLRKPNSSDYLLAIECDGATYHSSKNARDRDSLRQSVLENMGWQFYRIWSTDWYRKKSFEKERLLKAVQEAVEIDNESEVQEPIPNSFPKQKLENVEERFVTQIHESEVSFPEYEETDALNIIWNTPGTFQTRVRKILETESPLSEEFLLKRIVAYYGREKVTKTVQRSFNYEMQGCEKNGIIRKNGFLYLEEQTDYVLRIPGIKRDIKYISIEELASGLHTLIKQNVTVTRDGLYKTMTSLLGYNRTGEAIVSKYNTALILLKTTGLVYEDDNALLSLKQ